MVGVKTLKAKAGKTTTETMKPLTVSGPSVPPSLHATLTPRTLSNIICCIAMEPDLTADLDLVFQADLNQTLRSED
jgi:hypothetical protein